jgi:peptidyl-prolyl isomerase E (cyclophilin E)
MFCHALQVNYAQPMKIKGGDKGWSHQPVWADADEYLAEQQAEEEFARLEKEQEDRRKQQQLQQQLQQGPDPMEALEAAAGGS